tara:strand:+ start:195 stop:1223 length:1029 start_codon:yes stop_codon:yes gene_type:complete
MKMIKIESMPAKICLGISALLLFIYSMSFMFFATEYVTGGDTGFSLINNGLAGVESDEAYGHGGPESAFNGVLFFGIFISTMLILFEGAKGKWRIMLPVTIGMATMSACIWAFWNPDSAASDTPKYVSILVTLVYFAAYMFLREEGVNDGLSDFKPGLKVKDKIAMSALILLVIAGLYYSLRMIFTPDEVISQGFPSDMVDDSIDKLGLGAPLPTTVSVTGAMLLIYTLWSALVLMEGASGKWTIMHPSAMAFVAATVTTYVGLVAGTARIASDINRADILTIPVITLLVLISYYRLKKEGMEDEMTFMGEPAEGGMFTNGLLILALILGLLTAWNNIDIIF